jgi:hypothetical protein
VGKGSEEALKDIEETREALGHKVDALVSEVRESAGRARSLGMKVGLVALGVTVGFLILRRYRNK